MIKIAQCLKAGALFLLLGFGVGPAAAAPGGPNPVEFQNSYWVYCETSCQDTVYWRRIHLKDDGSSGYQKAAGEEFTYDGTDHWKLVGPYLVLMWSDAEAVEVFQVGTGNAQTYSGLHSGVDVISVIQRAKESGGTLPEP